MIDWVYLLVLVWWISVNKLYDLLLYIIYVDVWRIKLGFLMCLNRLGDVLCWWFSGIEVRCIKSFNDMYIVDFFFN